MSPVPPPAVLRLAWASMAPEHYVKVVKEGHVGQVILGRPSKLNVMDDGFFAALHRSVTELDDDVGLRCLVVAAEGKHFTAGLDLKDAAATFCGDATATSRALFAGSLALGKIAGTAPIAPSEPGMPALRNQRLYRLIRRWQAAVSSLHAARLPVIAAVHGKCLGAGVDLVTAADIRFCTRDVEFVVKELDVGIVADLGTLHRLGGLVGRGVARELALTGRTLTADRALALGLVTQVFESRDEMLAAALACARDIAARSPLAVQGTKRVMNFAEEHPLETGLEHVALWNAAFLKSDDLVAATAAFLTKTQPAYRDHCLPAAPPPAPPGPPQVPD